MNVVPDALKSDVAEINKMQGGDDIKKPLINVLKSTTGIERELIDRVGIDEELTEKINLAIKNYQEAKAQGKKTKKPKFKIGNNTWVFDKIEKGRVMILNDGTMMLCIERGDMLGKNNTYEFDDKEQIEDVQESKLKDELSERAEITLDDEFDLGKTYKISWEFLFPGVCKKDDDGIDCEKAPNRTVLGQIKQTAQEGVHPNPLLCQRMKEEYFTTFNNSGDPTGNGESKTVVKQNIEEIIGKWVKVEYEIKFSEGDEGYIKIIQNGKVVWEFEGRVSSSSDIYPSGDDNDPNAKYAKRFFMKLGLYRDVLSKKIRELNYELNMLMQEGNGGIDHDKEARIEKLRQDIAEMQELAEAEKDGDDMNIYIRNFNLQELSESETA